jgi:hypothetical protein
VLTELAVLIGCIDGEIYGPFEIAARQRLQKRDEEDWPVLAAAMALECPIWTEDVEFFGTGVATWTTDALSCCFGRRNKRTSANRIPNKECGRAKPPAPGSAADWNGGPLSVALRRD